MKKVLALALPLAVVASFALAGCNDDKDDVSDEALSLAASDVDADTFFADIVAAQREAGSAHLDVTAESDDGALSLVGDIAVAEDLAASSASLTVNLDAMGLGHAEVRLVDGTVFAQLGALTGDKFIKLNLDELQDFAPAKKLAARAQDFDFAAALESFQRAVESIEPVGEPVSLDGVEAQGYDITLDLTKLDLPRDGAKKHDLPDQALFTLFVGPDDLVRRVSADHDGNTVTADFSQWGQPVSVVAPGDDEISDLDLTKLLRGFGGFGDA